VTLVTKVAVVALRATISLH